LTFPASLVAEHPHQLPAVIARALAEALLHANRRHWALVETEIEGPLARWERRQGKRADDVRRGAKIDHLEAAHRRAYQREVTAVLAGWGSDAAAGATPDGPAGKF
jgi:hypothetical protein